MEIIPYPILTQVYLKKSGTSETKSDNSSVGVVTIKFGTHTNYALAVAVDPISIFTKLKETYTIKDFGLPRVHLVCEYSHIRGALLIGWSWVPRPILLKPCRMFAHYLRLQTCIRRSYLAVPETILN